MDTASSSQVVHLPIDGILNRISKARSFVLGIVTLGDADPSLVRSVITDTVARCSEKARRNAILITVRPPNELRSHDLVENGNFSQARWSYFDDANAGTKSWHAQLADLPRWKQEFGLIVFDLGAVCLPMMPRIGRLCDGIVVQMLDPSNSRETIQALKSLQKNRLTILGAWSVELNSRNIAA